MCKIACKRYGVPVAVGFLLSAAGIVAAAEVRQARVAR
jgi:hypothetical protein